MSTKKFLTIITVALVAFVLVVGSVAFAIAEEDIVYYVDAVVINFEETPWGDVEVEVYDEDGNIWGYYADENVNIGDIVTLTIYVFSDLPFENAEIVDAELVDHLSTLEMIQWIRR